MDVSIHGSNDRFTCTHALCVRRFNPEFLRERKIQLQNYLDAATALPSLLDACSYARRFFEVRWEVCSCQSTVECVWLGASGKMINKGDPH